MTYWLPVFLVSHFQSLEYQRKTLWEERMGLQIRPSGTLFFDVVRILDYHRPKAFLLENVKNLKSHDKGNTFEVIKNTDGRSGLLTSYAHN